MFKRVFFKTIFLIATAISQKLLNQMTKF